MAAGCALLYAMFIWRPSFVFRGERWFTLFDDGMISLTYARNLAEGHGLVWNPGGPAVEGYTNPLWTLIMAAAHRVGVGENLVPLVVSVISAVLLLGCIWLAAGIARHLRPEARLAPVLAAVFTGLYYPLVYWALRGMEVGLVTFLLLAGVRLSLLLADRATVARTALLALVLAAGLLTRDDFVVPAGVIGVWLLIVLRGRVRWSVCGALAATGVAVIGAQVAFRLSYYGEPLPNTYYLKVSGQPLAPRLWRGLMTFVAWALADAIVLGAFVAAGLRIRKGLDRNVALLLGLIGALVTYSIFVGGDAWEWARLANRYVTPAVVLLLILAATMVEPVVAWLQRSSRGLFALVAIVAIGLAFALVDSFVGVVLHGWIGDYLGATPTDSDQAAITVVVLAIVIGGAWLLLGQRRIPTRWARPTGLAVLLAVVLLVATTGSAWRSWVGDGGFYTAKNRGATAYGLELQRLTDPGATIAVIWAGAPIYYAHRDGVDLLGKMDPVIAHGPHHPGAPVYPGHDKFDFDYSIGKLRPDLIAQYAWFTEADVDRFVAEGYVPMRLRPGVADDLVGLEIPRALLWVRDDSTLVHRELLEPVPLDEAKAISVEGALAAPS